MGYALVITNLNVSVKCIITSIITDYSHICYYIFFSEQVLKFHHKKGPTLHPTINLNHSVLGPAIDANSGLEYLNLSWNHLRGKGGIAIGRGLRANCSLQTLDLSWNGLADEGAAAVGESLKENNTLIDLDLSNNRISTEGALALSKGLQINNTLKILRFV